MSVDIGRDTVLALCAVGWADGKMDPAEAASIRDAAKQLGLSAEDLSAVEGAIAQRMGLELVETLRMSRLTRLFTYAVGTLVASVDGAIGPEEQATLALLGDRLGLSQVARDRAQNVAHAARQAGTELDLLKLRSRLSAGLSQIGNE
ncbi:MAG: TerB family tellurite resistance protein [Myxococcales bacterium]|nr:TerB family tellurite resistance protein [Myxococcales bacterium]MCB9579850.1 TerB family tellurite resistance protein [Polyangiaceae bacterium]